MKRQTSNNKRFTARMTIRKKMLVGFGVVNLLLISSLIWSYLKFIENDNAYSELLDDDVISMQESLEIKAGLALQERAFRGYLIDQDESGLQTIETARNDIGESLAILKDVVTSPERQQTLSVFETDYSLYNNELQRIVNLADDDGIEEARASFRDLSPLSEQLRNSTNSLEENFSNQLNSRSSQLSEEAAKQGRVLLFLTVGLLIISIVSIVYISSMISKPIILLRDATRKMAEGDLSGEDVDSPSNDEIGELSRSFNLMKQNLINLIENVQSNSQQVAAYSQELYASTEEIAATAQDSSESFGNLVDGSKTINMTTDRSTKNLIEMTNNLNKIMKGTEQIDHNSSESLMRGSEGGKFVANAETTMELISEATKSMDVRITQLSKESKEIEAITQVIQSITEQTNLLALNATIEAARAGEHGKGFAVVAQEVRKLAEQSKDSANEIFERVQSIQRHTSSVEESFKQSKDMVNRGSHEMSDASKSFNEIIQRLEDSKVESDSITALTKVTNDQAQTVLKEVMKVRDGVQDVTITIEGANSGLESQLSMMEEINGVAETMSQMAIDLQQLLVKFKTA